MRNLKRALSLTLASVMLLGMMVVGSSAAAGYDDVKETDNVEAIEVLQAVEVMVGDDRGFGPDRPVNRAEMAVVMGKLLNLDYNYYVSTCPFTDVSGNYDWAKGWVGACAANGIVSGRGNGVYDPGATVTAVEAASMMMRALGYFKYTEDYADGFNVVTVRQGSQIGIFNGVGTDANTPMTRNQVAQMALNALESEMVTFTGTPGVSVNGVNVGYRAEYTPRTSTQTKYQAIERRTSDVSGGNNLNRGQYYIQLGEELYDGKLTKKYDTDDFERPSINWQYNGKEIGVYVDYDLLVAGGTFTTPVKYSELYNLLTFTTINDNDLYRYVDGVDQKESKENFARSNKDEVGGQGVLTEVFYNQDREEIIVTSINTYLAKANSDYNSTNETLSLKVFETNGTGTTKIVDSEDVDEAADVAKDEFRLVYMSGKDNAANKLEVVRIFDAPIMTDTQITKWSKHDTKVVDKLTTDGTEYKTNPKAYYDKNGDVLLAYNEQRLTDTSYNIFMDRYDNVIGVDLYEGTKNYVFITGYDRINSNISVKTADAAAIFMDGTMEVITVNVTDTDKNIRNTKANAANYVEWSHYSREGCRDLNRWYTYTTAANGNYTLKPVERSFYTSYNSISDFDTKGVKVLNTANLYLNDARPTNGTVYTNQGRIYGNDDSVYITVEPGYVDTSTPTASHDAITDVQGVYTGAQDVKLEISTTSKELVNERKGASHATSVYPDTSVDYSKVDYGEVNNPSEQNAYVYSVYDSNYYIIASVVLGDAQGAAANYAYILGDAKSEWVEHGDKDDTYYWEFEAVLNGEKQTLTVKSKYEDTIDDLRKYHVQELRFDGEYVTAIKEVDNDKVMKTNNDTSLKTDDFDVYDVGHTTARVATDAWANSQNIHTDANGTTHNGRYEYDFSDHRIDGTIELVGRTLYTERPHDVGLALTSDAKAVLIQKENKSVETTQCDSVAEAIGRLADADTRDVPAADGIQFHGRIVAVLDSAGAAKWVVIISDTLLLTGNRPGYGENDDIWMELIEGTATEGHYWKLHVPYSRDIYSARPSSEEIAGWLADAGCTEISKDREGWNFVRRGVTHTNQAVEVVWCGYDHFHEDTVLVTGVTLDEATAEVKVGKTVTLTATVSPSNATNKAVRWSSGDTTVATVSNGVVTGVKAGTATITVSTVDGGYTASCVVTVKAEEPDVEYTVSVDAIFEPGVNCVIKVGDVEVKDGDKVKNGTVSINPADRIAKVTVDDAGKTIKIESNGYTPLPNSAGTRVVWMGQTATGGLDTPTFIVPADRSAARMMRARAASNDPADWEEGDSDTLNIDLFIDASADVEGAYSISCEGEYKGQTVNFTWTKAANGTSWELVNPDGSKDYITASGAVIGKMFTTSGTLTKGEAETPVEPTESFVKAEITKTTTPYNARIIVYNADGMKAEPVTKAQIAEALNEAGEALSTPVSFGLTADDIADTGASATTALGSKINLIGLSVASAKDKTYNATQVYKVTYPGGYTFIDKDNTKQVSDVEAGVTTLILDSMTVAVATSQTKVTTTDLDEAGQATLPAPLATTAAEKRATPGLADCKDTEYVAAIRMNGADTNGVLQASKNEILAANGSSLLKVNALDVVTKEPLEVKATDAVRAGTPIILTAGANITSTGKGRVISLYEGGETEAVLELTVLENGTVEETEFYLDPSKVVNAGSNIWVASLTVSIGAAPAAEKLPVYLNGEEITPDENGNFYITQDQFEDGNTIVGAVEHTDGATTAKLYSLVATIPTLSGASAKFNYTDLTTAAGTLGLSEDEEQIDLYTAWSIASSAVITSTHGWAIYTKDETDEYVNLQSWGADGHIADTGYVLTSDPETLYVIANEAGLIFAWDGETTCLDGQKRAPIGAGETDDGSKGLTGIWEFIPTSPITASSFDIWALFTMKGATPDQDKVDVDSSKVELVDAGGSSISALPSGKTTKLTLNQVSFTKNASGINAEWKTDVEGVTLGAPTVDKNGVLTINVTVDKDVTLSSGDTVGSINFDFGNEVIVEIPVTIA